MMKSRIVENTVCVCVCVSKCMLCMRVCVSRCIEMKGCGVNVCMYACVFVGEYLWMCGDV